MSNAQPKIIIISGVDRSGKDTLLNEIDRQTKYRHMTIDRGPEGFKAYCEIYDKDPALFTRYDHMEQQMASQPGLFLLLYVDCSTEELERRCRETNHEILPFDYHKSVYEKYVDQSPLKKVRVDTTSTSAKDIVKKLIDEGIL